MTNATPEYYEVPLKINGIPVGEARIKHTNSGYVIADVAMPATVPSYVMEELFNSQTNGLSIDSETFDFPTVFNAMFGTKPEFTKDLLKEPQVDSDHDMGFTASEGTEDVPCSCESDFVGELTALLNRFSAESISGTPDFILAEYLQDSIKAFNAAVVKRADWRGESVEPPSIQRQRDEFQPLGHVETPIPWSENISIMDTVSVHPESETLEAGDFKMKLAPDNVNVTINNYYGKDN